MSKRRAPRGDSKIGCVLWLLAALIFAMIVWKAVPVKIQDAEFKSFLEEQARFAARSNAEQIRTRILARAKEMRIPLDPKKLQVRKGGRRIRIECSYTVPLDFQVYTYNWTFEHVVDRPIFII